jgi:hypothetical protein
MRHNAIGIKRYVEPVPQISGSFATTPTEAEVIAGTQTIIIDLTNALWVPAGALFDAQRQAIIDGLSSSGAESTGWNTLVRDVMAVTTVVRTSDTRVTVTLPATPLYKITAAEVVTFTPPPTAVEGYPRAVAVDYDTLTVANAAPSVTAALTGTLLTTPTEGEVVTGGQTIIITLTGGTWVVAGASSFNAVRQAIIDGLVSDGVEETGWNTLVRDVIAVTTVVRTSDTIVTVTLPAIGSYSIDSAEEVTVTIPKEAVALADADVVAAETIDIQPD